ncbi:polysaccharide deacetylase family protein [Vreelandella profundi]|uniref:polysaccharide deacetylase family protein n=1 Tax=Vreelandella profundi TaxID=2852117 RepID=UPI001F2FA1D4|nr:polysaccharide deacetylase family protein [Halomonas profundi]
MKRILKKKLKTGFVTLGGPGLLQRIYREPKVFFWHGVENHANPLIEAESITADQFSAQLCFIERNYEVVSLDEFHIRYKNGLLKGREAVLTFDDGYENNLTVLAPIMKKMDLPFTVFISTAHITSQKLFPTSVIRLIIYGTKLEKVVVPALNKSFSLENIAQRKSAVGVIASVLKTKDIFFVNQVVEDVQESISRDELDMLTNKYQSLRPMTWGQVRELSNQGATIGSHCIEHICCHRRQEEREVKSQIFKSKQLIEEKLGKPCDYFAFPNGDFSDYSVKCVKDAGYKMGFITKNLKIDLAKDQDYVMPRLSAPFDKDTFQIVASLPVRK